MLSGDISMEIIALCKEIEAQSNTIYNRLSENAEEEGIKHSLQEMASDEKEAVESWQSLLNLIENANIQPVFDEPEKLKNSLKSILAEIEIFSEKSGNRLDVHSTFLVMYNLEFTMIHRSLINLYYYIDNISPEGHFMDNHEKHIKQLVSLLDGYESFKELKVLSKVLLRIWMDNKDFLKLCNYDYLTNVFNRRGFYQVLRPLAYSSQRSSSRSAVMMIDVDNFKKINDTHGHHVGDVTLRLIAKNIQKHTRHSDLVGRYGGEEFLIFLSDVSPDYLFKVAENIRQEIERSSKADLPVTVSIGISQRILSNNIDGDLDDLIGEADQWMMKAKKAGKNRVMGQHL